jgi:hypothetical protein
MTVRLELYVRSLLASQAHEQQNAVVDRLQSLDDEDVVSDVDIVVWGRQAPASPAQARTDAGEFALNRVAVFTTWAERNGCSLEGHFEYRTIESEFRRESYRAVRFPVMTLAEYHDEALAFVAPVTTPDGPCTVQDRLDHIQRRSTAADDNRSVEPLSSAYSEPPSELTLTDRDDPDLPEA